MTRVLIVEDDPAILRGLKDNLALESYEVLTASDGEAGYRLVREQKPDLVILDLMLPRMSGYEVCRKLRQEGDATPILMLTARGEEADRVLGLDLGADDYVTKPFSVKELVARIHAVLRRPGGGETVRRIAVGPLVIDLDKFEVLADGNKVDLTATEFRILQFLAARRGRVFTRDQILDFLWGTEKAVVDRTVDVHIRNLREKMGAAASLIKNIRGVGYKLEE